MFWVAIIPSPRPWNRAGVTEVVFIPLEVAQTVNASCSSPGHHSGFIMGDFVLLSKLRYACFSQHILQDMD